MKKGNYKYRIKTLKEFETEYGKHWRDEMNYDLSFPDCMDFLLGTDIIDERGKYFKLECGDRIHHRDWTIISCMVKKIIISPTYKKIELKY